MLRQSPTQGRSVLQRVLRGRIVFTPKGEGYTFAAETRFDKLWFGIPVPFSGFAGPRPSWLPNSRQGTEHIRPEDTFDVDYGKILDLAYVKFHGKGVTSPTGFEPVFWP